ncbi:MAG: glycosyltransferase [Rhodothermales bacterium]|nr:glycosyltransferase [Rhodothermales bacterium]
MTRAVHTVASLAAHHGGPSRSVTALASALAARELGVHLVSSRPEEGERAVQPEGRVSVHLTDRPSGAALLRRRGAGPFFEALVDLLTPGSVLHDHGFWLPSNHLAAAAARRAGAPLVVSPRGMLTPWALRHRAWKKRGAWRLYQRRDVAAAALLHATSEAEAAGFRTLGLPHPIAVVPNGVDLPEAIPERGRRDGAPRRALFLSRIHPVKGVLNLVRAWAQVQPKGWELVIAGPDAEGHRADVEGEIRHLGAPGISFTGPVQDAEKWELYGSADLFVLPTFSENFGIVVAEALGAGLPAITTTAAPWEELEAHRCGWWVEVGAEPLAEALAAATTRSDEALAEMGARGRALIRERYAWQRVAADMGAAYAWLLGEGARPDCVRTTEGSDDALAPRAPEVEGRAAFRRMW